jgi:hypothetical protein
MSAWFKSTKTKSKGVYMPQKEFKTRVGKFLSEADGALSGHEYSDRIMRRMSNAFQFGVNERFEFFFQELGLPINEGEKKVIGARNKAAHGGAVSDTEQQKMFLLAGGYRTLMNRVFLKLFGYSGDYIDYSVVGHPSRHLDEPIGIYRLYDPESGDSSRIP